MNFKEKWGDIFKTCVVAAITGALIAPATEAIAGKYRQENPLNPDRTLFRSSINLQSVRNTGENDVSITSEPKKNNSLRVVQEITGTVKDSTGAQLPGVSIRVKGASFGTVTDVNGRFSINVESNAVLIITYVGYHTQEVAVSGREAINIILKESVSKLDEVVVMAYGSTIKRKLIAAVTTVDVKKIETLSGYKDLGNALQGRVAGVLITNSSGGPNSNATISIRGGGDPLYVIDGIRQDKAFFNRINPIDIESLNVMKDAASTAVYGAQGSNGIIVVKTKQGKAGKTRISYTLDNQFNTPSLLNDKLTALQEVQMKNSISNYMGLAKPFSPAVVSIIENGGNNDYPDNNYNELLVKDFALSQRHIFTMDGGSEQTQFRTSFLFYKQGTLQKKVAGDLDPIDYKTYSMDLNFNHTFSKIGLKLGVDMKPYITDNKSFGPDPWLTLQSVSALTKTYNADGSYSEGSPIAQFADTRAGYDKVYNYGSDFRTNLDWQIPYIKGLKALFGGAFSYGSDRRKTWEASVPTYKEDGSIAPATPPQLTLVNRYAWRYEFNTGLNYETEIAKAHNIYASLFVNQRQTYDESVTGKRINYYDNVDQLFAGPTDGQTTAGGANESGSLGYVGVFNYDYKGRYLLSSSFRYDGMDGYRPGARWDFFPSVTLGYVMSDEPFMAGVKEKLSLDMLKLRASTGNVGEVSSRFDYLSSWALNPNGAYINGALAATVLPGQLASKDLTWYTTKTWNVGLDLSFFRNRLGASADYFFRRTTGYLVNPVNVYNSPLGNLTGTSGANYVTGLPKIISDDAFRRAGGEFQLTWQDKIRSWSYGIGANLSFYDELWEKYTAVDDAVALANPNARKTYITKDMGNRAYVYRGLMRNSTDLLNTVVQTNGNTLMAGDVIFQDTNGDGRIDAEDQVYDNNPRSAIMQFGIPFNLGYKGFSLEGLLQGTGPQYGMLDPNLRGTGWNRIRFKNQLDFYSPENPNAALPRADNDFGSWNGEFNRAESQLWLVNKTYLRLKNLNIGYDLKNVFKNEKWFSRARLAVAGTNIFTISKAKDYFDPETGSNQFNSYPITKTYSVVLNVGF